jgi:polysaccharide export outer membrane protein
MREQPVRMLCLSLFVLSGLFIIAGCQSTGSLPPTLPRDPVVLQGPIPQAAPSPATTTTTDGIAWKRSTAPSTALAQESWTNPPRSDDPVRATAFQAQPATPEPAPMPGIMIKDSSPPKQMTAVQPAGLRYGPRHGVQIAAPPGAPTEMNPVPVEYRIRPPDVLFIDSLRGLTTAPVTGSYMVRPDGTVGISTYGSAQVSGLTIEEARPVIARTIYSKMSRVPTPATDQKGTPLKDKDGKLIMIEPYNFDDVLKDLNVNVLAYNSSFYYVIVDAAGLGEQVYRFPVTGHETVLDGISLIGGLQMFSSPKRIWVARKNAGPDTGHDSKLPVDWKGITREGEMNTNWQVMPGDRIYVKADPVHRFNNQLAKFLTPVKEVLGVTLLGSQTVNSIKSGTVSGGP